MENPENIGLRVKIYNYLIGDGREDKKPKRTKKCIIKEKLKFQDYKNCLEATQLENKINNIEWNEIYEASLKKVIENSWKTRKWY